MTLRGVLFDATGTLIELREPVGNTYARVAREFDVELPADQLGAVFAHCFQSAPPMLFPLAPPERIPELERGWWLAVVRRTIADTDPSARFRSFDRFFEKLYAAYSSADCWRARPGSREVLRALRERGLETGVISNFDHRLTNIMEQLDFSGLLKSITLPAQARAQKPDPRIFEFALERIGLSAEQVAFVGDDELRDLRGAREVGMTAIDVATLVTLEELPDRLTLS